MQLRGKNNPAMNSAESDRECVKTDQEQEMITLRSLNDDLIQVASPLSLPDIADASKIEHYGYTDEILETGDNYQSAIQYTARSLTEETNFQCMPNSSARESKQTRTRRERPKVFRSALNSALNVTDPLENNQSVEKKSNEDRNNDVVVFNRKKFSVQVTGIRKIR